MLPKTAAEIMSRRVHTVLPEMSLASAVELMLEKGLSGLPVVTGSGRLVGMISKTDVVRETRREEHPTREAPEASAAPAEVRPTTVRDVMTHGAIRVSPDCPIPEAAQLLTRTGVHRLAVVDGRGRLVGILSSMDILRWVALG